MYLSVGNVLRQPARRAPVHRLRAAATAAPAAQRDASVEPDDPLLARFPGAQFVVRVRAREVFPNCPRYIHRMQLVERSPFVPRAGRETPVPEWKRTDWARDVLPADDPARA